jgi:hypothetical protein
LVLAATWSRAENLPNEIRILVPVTAGSSLDARARVIADAIGQRLKHRIIVENRPGRDHRRPCRGQIEAGWVNPAFHQQQPCGQPAYLH